MKEENIQFDPLHNTKRKVLDCVTIYEIKAMHNFIYTSMWLTCLAWLMEEWKVDDQGYLNTASKWALEEPYA